MASALVSRSLDRRARPRVNENRMRKGKAPARRRMRRVGVELDIPVRPPEEKKEAEEKNDDAKKKDDANKKADEELNADKEATDTPQAMPARETKTFFARSHLIVTVPIYVRWPVLDWEDR